MINHARTRIGYFKRAQNKPLVFGGEARRGGGEGSAGDVYFSFDGVSLSSLPRS